MTLPHRARSRSALLLVMIPLYASSLQAQSSDVPRTLPGVPDLWFDYAHADDAGPSVTALQALADEVASWASAGDVMGAELLVVKDGRAVLHESVGWSDRERGLPLRRNSIFRIRSMSKPLLGTAVLMLMEADELSLDDTVAESSDAEDSD